jgi:hypothetical protein
VVLRLQPLTLSGGAYRPRSTSKLVKSSILLSLFCFVAACFLRACLKVRVRVNSHALLIRTLPAICDTSTHESEEHVNVAAAGIAAAGAGPASVLAVRAVGHQTGIGMQHAARSRAQEICSSRASEVSRALNGDHQGQHPVGSPDWTYPSPCARVPHPGPSPPVPAAVQSLRRLKVRLVAKPSPLAAVPRGPPVAPSCSTEVTSPRTRRQRFAGASLVVHDGKLPRVLPYVESPRD